MNAQYNRRALTTSAAASTPPPIRPLPPDTPVHAPPLSNEQINPPAPPVPNPSTFDSSAAFTVLVLLSALFFLGFFSLYVRRFVAGGGSSSSYAATTTTTVIFSRPAIYTFPPQRAIKQKAGLDAATIRSMPCFAYDGGGGAVKYQTECSVCLSEFEEGETVKVMPQCEHLFHAQCIDRWLNSHASCPVCRSTTHQNQ